MASLRLPAGLAILVALAPSPARAADPAIALTAALDPPRIGPGDKARLRLSIDVPEGWHLWSLDPGEGPSPLRLGFRPGAPVQLAGEWRGPPPKVVFDRGFQRELKQYGQGKLVLDRHVELASTAKPGKESFTVTARGQICSEDACIPQNVEARVEVEVAADKTGAPPPDPEGEVLGVAPEAAKPKAPVAAPAPRQGASPAPAAAGEPAKASMGPTDGQSIWRFLAIAFLAGLAALATPCVFPAIPLTVSFFSKFSEVSVARGARLATFYALMMITFFTFAGVVMSIIFGVTGIQSFAAHPAFNLGLGLMLVFFSLNLLGWFDIQAPAFLLNFTNRLEGKYGPNAQKEGGGLGDYAAVAVAAMTSTTVFFTCTVGFVGAVLVAAAQGNWFWPTLGMLAFSSAFVTPFFFLALFPQAAKRLRGRNGNWLTATRVCLGFVELAASIKFLSNADLVWKTGIISRSAALSLWVVLFGLCGLFLLGKLEIGEEGPSGGSHHISVPRMLLSAVTLAFTLYLGAGLLDHRPLGWVDGWLPPSSGPEQGTTQLASGGGGALKWVHDLEEGRRKAGEACSLVFVNYTGITCTNCRFMESSIFTNARVGELLNKMVLVELITDGGAPEHELARNDQVARFGTAALPLYSIEKPDGTRIARFESSTNDADEFRRFIEDAMKGKSTAAEVCATGVTGSADPIRLETTRLADKKPEPAAVTGKWSLINFWATWCGPCREELSGFLVAKGKDVEARGGRFAAVAVETADTADQARAFMEKLQVPAKSALFLDAEKLEGAVDKRLGFTGADLPYTALVSPEGKVVWTQSGKLDEAKLQAVLTEHMGFAALR